MQVEFYPKCQKYRKLELFTLGRNLYHAKIGLEICVNMKILLD